MASGNWIVDNLNNALETWNDEFDKIWLLITQSLNRTFARHSLFHRP